jgi:hypothetical protein
MRRFILAVVAAGLISSPAFSMPIGPPNPEGPMMPWFDTNIFTEDAYYGAPGSTIEVIARPERIFENEDWPMEFGWSDSLNVEYQGKGRFLVSSDAPTTGYLSISICPDTTEYVHYGTFIFLNGEEAPPVPSSPPYDGGSSGGGCSVASLAGLVPLLLGLCQCKRFL